LYPGLSATVLGQVMGIHVLAQPARQLRVGKDNRSAHRIPDLKLDRRRLVQLKCLSKESGCLSVHRVGHSRRDLPPVEEKNVRSDQYVS